jgi:proteasome beta subunit
VGLNLSNYRTSDFLEILERERPELLTRFNMEAFHPTPLSDVARASWTGTHRPDPLEGTTILAAVFKDGVALAGDRQASAGFQVGERRIEKVYQIDDYSAIAIAGIAGPCIELAKIFQVQVEFYEKIEGAPLSLEGKANYLSNMVKSNLMMALQGLVVIPIFAGYDHKRKQGRIFKYDVTGGRYDESEYYAIGSGGKDAQATFKKRYTQNMSRAQILKIVVEALWDAADEDLATGGPDFIRDIYPTIKVIDRTGTSDIPDSEVKTLFNEYIEGIRS